MNQPVRHFFVPADVIAAYCTITQVPLHQLTDASKAPVVSRPRHDCMWLLRDLTAATSAQIGQLLGGRHQTTVDEAVAKVADRIAAEPEYRDRLRHLRSEIVAWVAAPATVGPYRITAARAVLEDEALTDADARVAALALLGGRNAA